MGSSGASLTSSRRRGRGPSRARPSSALVTASRISASRPTSCSARRPGVFGEETLTTKYDGVRSPSSPNRPTTSAYSAGAASSGVALSLPTLTPSGTAGAGSEPRLRTTASSPAFGKPMAFRRSAAGEPVDARARVAALRPARDGPDLDEAGREVRHERRVDGGVLVVAGRDADRVREAHAAHEVLRQQAVGGVGSIVPPAQRGERRRSRLQSLHRPQVPVHGDLGVPAGDQRHRRQHQAPVDGAHGVDARSRSAAPRSASAPGSGPCPPAASPRPGARRAGRGRGRAPGGTAPARGRPRRRPRARPRWRRPRRRAAARS